LPVRVFGDGLAAAVFEVELSADEHDAGAHETKNDRNEIPIVLHAVTHLVDQTAPGSIPMPSLHLVCTDGWSPLTRMNSDAARHQNICFG
jgi:hypothetical protein